jgi:hypothetical protein
MEVKIYKSYNFNCSYGLFFFILKKEHRFQIFRAISIERKQMEQLLSLTPMQGERERVYACK